MIGLEILGMGHALPETVLSNQDMEKIVETSDEWIRSRTGIGSRYFCRGGESLAGLASEAAGEAVLRAGVPKEKIGLLILATCTTGYQVPSAACVVQQMTGLPAGIPAFDVNAACSGFLYGLQIAHAMGNTGYAGMPERPYMLVIGVEELSDILDYGDRATCVLFGDGAAAAVLRMSEEHRFFSHIGAAGCREMLYTENTDTAHGRKDLPDGRARTVKTCLHMDGSAVFRFAVEKSLAELEEIERISGVSADEAEHVVFHQANSRILEHVRKKRALPEEKVFTNLEKVGNTSAASIPLAIYDMETQGLLKKGDRMLLVGFGAGLTWGSAYIEI